MGIALRARYGQRLDLALANERQHRRGRRPVDVDAAAQHVGDDEGAAAVGNAGDIEPMPATEIFGEELRHRPLGEAETELAGIGLGVGDEFGHRIGRHLRVDGEHARGARNERDRRKILQRIVFDLLGHDRLDDEGRACEQQRVAIGGRDRGRLGADRRAATGLVVDHDRLAELALQVLRQQPRHHVVGRARRVGHDDPHRFAREALGLGRRRVPDQRERRDGGDACESSGRGSAHALCSIGNISASGGWCHKHGVCRHTTPGPDLQACGSRDRRADDSLAFTVLATCKLVCERVGTRTMGTRTMGTRTMGGRAMPKPMGLIFAAAAMLASPVFVSPVLAATCPPPLAQASRLVLVTTQFMDTPLATLQLFRRASADMPWKRVSAAEPAVVGKAGLGWGYPFLDVKDGEEPEKVEGDNRTPAGFFRIGPSFGFAPSRRPGYIELKSGETVCVEDPSSPFYNTITQRANIGAVEADDMRSSALYRSGLFVDYPSDRATRRGSCIFIHIWSAPDTGTSGCVGLPEARVEALQEFTRAGAVLAVLPATAFDRFQSCLPAPAARPATLTGGTR